MRRTIARGFACGFGCGSVVWIFAHPLAWWILIAGGIAGAAYASAAPRPSTALEDVAGAAALALPLWALIEVVIVPVASGAAPQWTEAGLRSLLPALVGWVIFGGALGGAAPRSRQCGRRRTAGSTGVDAHPHPGAAALPA